MEEKVQWSSMSYSFRYWLPNHSTSLNWQVIPPLENLGTRHLGESQRRISLAFRSSRGFAVVISSANDINRSQYLTRIDRT